MTFVFTYEDCFLDLPECCGKRCLRKLTNSGSVASANYLNRVKLDLFYHLDDAKDSGNTLDKHVKRILQCKLVIILTLLFLYLVFIVSLKPADCMINADTNGGEVLVEDNSAAGTSRSRFNYILGLFINDEDLRKQTPPSQPVCVKAFQTVYGLGDTRMKRLRKSIKQVIIITTFSTLSL